MKEKIKKFLIPWRENLEKKWWHRLLSVIIYGSTICLAILLFISLFSSSSWKKTVFTYSFEPNYNMSKGEESICKFNPYDSSGNIFANIFGPIRECNGINSSKDFLMKYDKYKFNDINKDSADKTVYDMEKSGKLNDIRVKRSTEIMYEKLFGKIGLAILLVFAWFIFWESIIYRIILYIIYGKNKTI